MKVVRLSALRTGRLYPRKYPWYSFLLEAESTPGPQCGRKDYVNENISNDTLGNRTRDLPICCGMHSVWYISFIIVDMFSRLLRALSLSPLSLTSLTPSLTPPLSPPLSLSLSHAQIYTSTPSSQAVFCNAFFPSFTPTRQRLAKEP